MEKSKFGDCRKFVILGPEDNTAFYDDHRALFKFIVQAPISEEDFHHLTVDGVCGCNSWKKITTAVIGIGRTKTTID